MRDRKPALNPRRELEDRAYQHGWKVARDSGMRDIDPATSRALEADASSMAQAALRPPSDVREERRGARFTELAEIRKRQELESDRAASAVANARKGLGDLGPPSACPAISRRLYIGSLFGLTISTAPTFHDMFVGLDGLLMWIGGIVCAVGVSLFIVHGIIHQNPEEQ